MRTWIAAFPGDAIAALRQARRHPRAALTLVVVLGLTAGVTAAAVHVDCRLPVAAAALSRTPIGSRSSTFPGRTGRSRATCSRSTGRARRDRRAGRGVGCRRLHGARRRRAVLDQRPMDERRCVRRLRHRPSGRAVLHGGGGAARRRPRGHRPPGRAGSLRRRRRRHRPHDHGPRHAPPGRGGARSPSPACSRRVSGISRIIWPAPAARRAIWGRRRLLRLRPGVTPSAGRGSGDGARARPGDEHRARWAATVRPAQDAHVDGFVRCSPRPRGGCCPAGGGRLREPRVPADGARRWRGSARWRCDRRAGRQPRRAGAATDGGRCWSPGAGAAVLHAGRRRHPPRAACRRSSATSAGRCPAARPPGADPISLAVSSRPGAQWPRAAGAGPARASQASALQHALAGHPSATDTPGRLAARQ